MEKAVADLISAIESPVLLQPQAFQGMGTFLSDACCQREVKERQNEILQLQTDSTALQAYLAANVNNHRLGIYFEALVGFWLRHVRKAAHVATNLPVRSGTATIGEFDAVFAGSEGGQAIHLEVAVKFYLCHQSDLPTPTLDMFWGPNAKDRLDRKVRRILDHQLKLAATPEGELILNKKNFHDVSSMAMVKGMLFYPRQTDWRHHAHPPEVSPGHQRGWWCRYSEFEKTISHPNSNPNPGMQGAVLQRHEWITPDLGERIPRSRLMEWEHLLRHLKNHFQSGGASLMIGEFEPSGRGGYALLSKGFVVPDSWPSDSAVENAVRGRPPQA